MYSMEQFLLAAAGLLAFVKGNVQNVTLNVILKLILIIVVNTSKKVVNLDYVTKDDYANGVTSVNADHLSIYSTGGFQIGVKSGNASMQNGVKNIIRNSIQIKATAGSDAISGAQYFQNVQLTENESTIVTSTRGGANKKINIEYKRAGVNACIDNYVEGQDSTRYITELTYTIVSQ